MEKEIIEVKQKGSRWTARFKNKLSLYAESTTSEKAVQALLMVLQSNGMSDSIYHYQTIEIK
jgi:hypothetical protein